MRRIDCFKAPFNSEVSDSIVGLPFVGSQALDWFTVHRVSIVHSVVVSKLHGLSVREFCREQGNTLLTWARKLKIKKLKMHLEFSVGASGLDILPPL